MINTLESERPSSVSEDVQRAFSNFVANDAYEQDGIIDDILVPERLFLVGTEIIIEGVTPPLPIRAYYLPSDDKKFSLFASIRLDNSNFQLRIQADNIAVNVDYSYNSNNLTFFFTNRTTMKRVTAVYENSKLSLLQDESGYVDEQRKDEWYGSIMFAHHIKILNSLLF